MQPERLLHLLPSFSAELTKLAQEKLAEIELGDNRLFFYIQLPSSLKARLSQVADKMSIKPEEIDHITLVHVPKAEKPLSPSFTARVVEVAKKAVSSSKPIAVKVQGWGYFDGAEKDGKEVTALVALLDAPGLEALHVKLKKAVQGVGVQVSEKHGFVPHATFAYLKKGQRVKDLPLLSGSFTIRAAKLATTRIHDLPLDTSAPSAQDEGMRNSH